MDLHDGAVVDELLHAVVGEWLVFVGVELVNEELGPLVQPRQVADAEDADRSHPAALARPLGPRPLRLVGERQPDARASRERLRLRVACSTYVQVLTHLTAKLQARTSLSRALSSSLSKVHETTTLLLVALPNIHRFKKMSLTHSAIHLS